MGKLTTHVLDIARGKPAAGMKIELWSYGTGMTQLKTVVTNSDGRVDEPLLEGEAFKEGLYQLMFFVAPYFLDTGMDEGFLQIVPVRFFVSDPTASYHVPLLVSPWAYSTYRGS